MRYEEAHHAFDMVEFQALAPGELRAIRALRVLSGRRGFNDWFDFIQSEIQDDIFSELATTMEPDEAADHWKQLAQDAAIKLGATDHVGQTLKIKELEQRIATLRAELSGLREAHGSAVIAQGEAIHRAEEAEAQFQKAKEWNALTEVELGLLQGLVKDMEDDTQELMTALRELCEKMEAGISGEDETKRARALLEKLK